MLFERREHIGIVTLNRPEAMNAVNAALATALGNLLDECSADPEIWAMVITGRGRGFCAGADLCRRRLGWGRGRALGARTAVGPRFPD